MAIPSPALKRSIKYMKITKIDALEILDSRGNPTLQVRVHAGSLSASASVPSGRSVGKHEAVELRDEGQRRYGGLGVRKAMANITERILPVLKGMSVLEQEKLDAQMLKIDGTANKSSLGANAILGVSLACARLAAKAQGVSLHKHLSKAYKFKPAMPVPLFNIINGGEHADNNLDIQEFIIIPKKDKASEMIRRGAEVFHALGKILRSKQLNTAVGNEGGYAPSFETNNQVFENILEAVKKAGYQPGLDFNLGIDAGASTFLTPEGQYYLKMDHSKLSKERLLALYSEWVEKYFLVSIEDGFAEDDQEGWRLLTDKLGSKVMLIGDDLFVTDKKRIQKGIADNIANAVLIKPNQIGTLTETIEAIKAARKGGYKVIISHRSGETEDAFIADLAFACGADYLKAGSLSRGERLAKYNRLIEIENQIKG